MPWGYLVASVFLFPRPPIACHHFYQTRQNDISSSSQTPGRHDRTEEQNRQNMPHCHCHLLSLPLLHHILSCFCCLPVNSPPLSLLKNGMAGMRRKTLLPVSHLLTSLFHSQFSSYMHTRRRRHFSFSFACLLLFFHFHYWRRQTFFLAFLCLGHDLHARASPLPTTTTMAGAGSSGRRRRHGYVGWWHCICLLHL